MKKVLTWGLSCLMGVGLLMPAVMSVSAKSCVSISTIQDLKDIAVDMTGCYDLANDIDLIGVAWIPLGDADNPFIGILNGNGHTISNLSPVIKTLSFGETDIDTMGLFSWVSQDATVYDLNLVLDIELDETATVNKRIYIGGLVGFGSLSTGSGFFSDISVSGSVNIISPSGVEQLVVGGLFGQAFQANMIEFSSFSGKISVDISKMNHIGEANVGGLVGYSSDTAFSHVSIYDSELRVVGLFGYAALGGISGKDEMNMGSSSASGMEYTHVLVDNVDISTSDFRSEVGGVIGWAMNETDDARHMSTIWVKDSLFSGKLATGSVIGNSTYTDLIYFQTESNVVSGVWYGYSENIGGVVGSSYYDKIRYGWIHELIIGGEEEFFNLGGVVGNGVELYLDHLDIDASITTEEDGVGGVVGQLGGVSIISLIRLDTKVKGNSNVGGLIGYAGTVSGYDYTGYIYNISADVEINATLNAGGLIGSVDGNLFSATMAIRGSVTAEANVGGLIGTSSWLNTSFDNGYVAVVLSSDSEGVIGISTGGGYYASEFNYFYFDADLYTGSDADLIPAKTADLTDPNSEVAVALGVKNIDLKNLDDAGVVNNLSGSDWIFHSALHQGYFEPLNDRSRLLFITTLDDFSMAPYLTYGRLYDSEDSVLRDGYRNLGADFDFGWETFATVEEITPTPDGLVLDNWYTYLEDVNITLDELRNKRTPRYTFTVYDILVASWKEDLPDTGESAASGTLWLILSGILMWISRKKRVNQA